MGDENHWNIRLVAESGEALDREIGSVENELVQQPCQV